MGESREDLKKLFAQKFKKLSKVKTNQELSELFDCDIKTIEKWKNESVKSGVFPKYETMIDICNILGCDMNYLLMEDSEHFDDFYKAASDRFGLSDNALKSIENIQNEIDENIRVLMPKAFYLRKNLFDYLLSEHPDFVVNMLDLIFDLMFWDRYYRGIDKQDESKYKELRQRSRDRHDMSIVRITRIISDLLSNYDYKTFSEQIGYTDYEKDRQKRLEQLNDMWDDGLIKAFDDIPKELIPYYKGTAEEADKAIKTGEFYLPKLNNPYDK